MSKVGEQLREERKRQNLSLQDIEAITSIRPRYLEAIENGHYSVLPGEVYTKGFIRNYAIALGLNGDDFVSNYKLETEIQELKDKADTLSKPQNESNTKTNIKDTSASFQNEKSGKKTKTLPIIIVCCFIIVIALGAYIAFDFANTKTEKNTINNTFTASNSTANTPIKQTNNNNNSDKKTIDFKIVNDKKGSITIVPDKGNTITDIVAEIEFNNSCWTRIVADGKELYSGILNKGSKTWQAKENLYIKLGNVSSAKMKVNDQIIDTIADSGPVVETTITIAK